MQRRSDALLADRERTISRLQAELEHDDTKVSHLRDEPAWVSFSCYCYWSEILRSSGHCCVASSLAEQPSFSFCQS